MACSGAIHPDLVDNALASFATRNMLLDKNGVIGRE